VARQRFRQPRLPVMDPSLDDAALAAELDRQLERDR
jgi:hypothetical protein